MPPSAQAAEGASGGSTATAEESDGKPKPSAVATGVVARTGAVDAMAVVSAGARSTGFADTSMKVRASASRASLLATYSTINHQRPIAVGSLVGIYMVMVITEPHPARHPPSPLTTFTHSPSCRHVNPAAVETVHIPDQNAVRRLHGRLQTRGTCTLTLCLHRPTTQPAQLIQPLITGSPRRTTPRATPPLISPCCSPALPRLLTGSLPSPPRSFASSPPRHPQ